MSNFAPIGPSPAAIPETGFSDESIIDYMARAMGEADGKRYWKDGEDNIVESAYKALARRQLYAHRAMMALLPR